MYVKGNAVLSKMFAHSGLTLNEIGLFYTDPEDSNYSILLTEDHVKIAEVMGFNYEEFDAAKEYEDFFALLYTNQYFRPSRFTEDPSEGKVRMFKELAEYIKARPDIHKGYTKRQLTDMFEPLKEFNLKARYERLIVLKEKKATIHKKFNGALILQMVPDYDKRKLQPGFIKFNQEYFPSWLDRQEFLYDHTPEEIVQKYLEITE